MYRYRNPAATTSSSNFTDIFDKALKAYEKKTKQDLTAHPLAAQLQACHSPTAILTILQDQIDQFNQSRSSDERLQKWLNPTINVLYAFSATLGEGVGLAFSPARVIFAGAGVLLLAAREVSASQDIHVDIFERIENFFRRLEIYIEVTPTPAMTDVMVKIIVEVLGILATATKEMKQSRAIKFLKKVAGVTNLEDGMKRLDRLTNEEVRMANAIVLKVTHEVDVKVTGVGDDIRAVDKKVQGVETQLHDVDGKVQVVDGKLQSVGAQMEDVKGGVHVVNDSVKVVEEKVQVIIDDGKVTAEEARLIAQRMADNTDDMKRNQLQESLRRWQSPSDPSTNHNIACGRQQGGTTGWFCRGSAFVEWEVTGSLLWIHGKPGSGKTILCSAVIEDITTLYEAGMASMAYFYFDFRDISKRTRRDLLRSFLIQLSTRSNPFFDILSRLYKAHDDGGRQPSDSALMQCLEEMLTLPDQRPIYLIMDALDECPDNSGIPSDRKQVLDFVEELVDLRLPSLHICVTSRPEVDIGDSLGPLTSHAVSLHEESGQRDDIDHYIRSVVYSDSGRFMKRWKNEDKDLVIQTLSEGADGMFRWVYCQLEMLQNCLPQNIRHVLKDLPKSLDETYERVLKEIGEANQRYARRLLQCLTVAIRPLRVEELAEILALDFDGAEEGGIPELNKDWRWQNQHEAVLSTCSSLVTIVGDGSDRVVQFSHFSVKEYLTSDRLSTSEPNVSYFRISLEPAHIIIVKACLGILLRPDNNADVNTRSPLAEYAAEHWVDHAQFEKVSASVEDGMRRLFDPAEPYFEAWLGIYDIDEEWFWFTDDDGTEVLKRAPLYHASLCGFRDVVAHLITEHSQRVNARVGRNYSPLVAALSKKHFEVAELLHQHGAVVNVMGYNNRTPLHVASRGGLVNVAQWLLDHGAEAEKQDNDGWTPLHFAVYGGHLEIVRMLLTHSINTNSAAHTLHPIIAPGWKGPNTLLRLELSRGHVLANKTALHLASSNGSAEIVRLLIKHGADVNTQDETLSTALHLASSSGYYRTLSKGKTESARLLIRHGADVNMTDVNDETALHLASSWGSPEIVELLIQHGADVNTRNQSLRSPLHLASSRSYSSTLPKGKDESVRLLVQHGADVNVTDMNNETPLHVASKWGSAGIVELLIQHGADVNARNQTRSTPLHLASYSSYSSTLPRGRAESVRLLVRHGADVNAMDMNNETALHLASSGGNAKIVELLIQHGADVNTQNQTLSTPLHLALSSGYSSMLSKGKAKSAQLLVQHGADVNVQDRDHSTPLQLLAQHGLDVNTPDRVYKGSSEVDSRLGSIELSDDSSDSDGSVEICIMAPSDYGLVESLEESLLKLKSVAIS